MRLGRHRRHTVGTRFDHLQARRFQQLPRIDARRLLAHGFRTYGFLACWFLAHWFHARGFACRGFLALARFLLAHLRQMHFPLARP